MNDMKARIDRNTPEYLKNYSAAIKKKEKKKTGNLAITPPTSISFFIRISILMTYSLFYTAMSRR